MSTSDSNSKYQLLRRLLNAHGYVPVEPPADVPDEFVACCERFIDGDLDEEELQEFQGLVASNPWLLTYLERWPQSTEEDLVAQDEKVSRMGEKMRQRCLDFIPRVEESFDFSILFDAVQEEMDIIFHRGGERIEHFEMAHGDNERTAISHTRSTKHFNLKITIAHTGGAAFDMSIEVQPIDLTIELEHCAARISRIDSGETVGSEGLTLTERVVSFSDLAEGAYKIELLYRDKSLEYFTMNLAQRNGFR